MAKNEATKKELMLVKKLETRCHNLNAYVYKMKELIINEEFHFILDGAKLKGNDISKFGRFRTTSIFKSILFSYSNGLIYRFNR